MIRLRIDVNNLSLVLQEYDQIKVYRADSEGGNYVEITDADTRIDLIPEKEIYYYADSGGTSIKWYKVSYFDSSTPAESDLSSAMRGGTEEERIGYSFGNYSAPPNEWGKALTPDDMRYTYLFGIDATGSDVNEFTFSDEQFDFYVESAVEDFERYMTIDILKRVRKTLPADALVQAARWIDGVDYTDEEDPYDFDPELWQNYGFIQLRHAPVLSVERCQLISVVDTMLIDFIARNWLRVQKKVGQINLFPRTGSEAYGPFGIGAAPWRLMAVPYPQGFYIDYTTGYKNSDLIPNDMREIIGKWSSIKVLASVGDGLMAGFSSSSVSLDGLSESFSSTQSATSAYFGARIKQYQDDIKEWLKRNRYKFGRIPLSFVGGF